MVGLANFFVVIALLLPLPALSACQAVFTPLGDREARVADEQEQPGLPPSTNQHLLGGIRLDGLCGRSGQAPCPRRDTAYTRGDQRRQISAHLFLGGACFAKGAPGRLAGGWRLP